MVFLSNRNLIQSEAVLRPRHAALSRKQQHSGTAPRRRQNGMAASAAAATQVPANGPDQAEAAAEADVEVDHRQLPCGYHVAIVAGLALIRAPSTLCLTAFLSNSLLTAVLTNEHNSCTKNPKTRLDLVTHQQPVGHKGCSRLIHDSDLMHKSGT